VDAMDESTPELAAEGMEEEDSRPMSTGELETVEPTPSDAGLDAFEGGDEDESKTEAFDAFSEDSEQEIRTAEEVEEIGAKTDSINIPDDEEFSFDDEIEPPKKKKKK
jgi:hypothetical protein